MEGPGDDSNDRPEWLLAASQSSSGIWTGNGGDSLGVENVNWGGLVGRAEDDEDVKRLRQRAQDNIEFRCVTISAPLHISGRRRMADSSGGSEGSLEMSISYRGRKGFMPDIESLVVSGIGL